MTSTSETGHAKNVSNFETLISFCTAYGESYNPSNVSLTIDSLNILNNGAQEELQKTKVAKTATDTAINSRRDGFADLKGLSTKIVNALSASGASTNTIDDAKGINRKLQGTRAIKIAPVNATPVDEAVVESKNISTSQLSYDNQIDNFAKLIEILAQTPVYMPNENDLKLVTLQSLLTSLKKLNTDFINSDTNWNNSLLNRDAIFYKPETGLVDIAIDVKKYIKSIFGATTSQFKQVSGLDFRNR
nr:hypothetical protein [Pedobacter sp. ASV2]